MPAAVRTRVQNYTIILPYDLYERAKAYSKKNRVSVAELMRRGVQRELDDLERHKYQMITEKAAAEAEQAKKYRNLTPLSRSVGGIGRIGRSDETEDDYTPELTRARLGDDGVAAKALEDLYKKHAEIVAQSKTPDEIRYRAAQAVKAIQKARPLTAPSEDEIVARLEEHVVEAMKEKPKPAKRSFDDLVGRVLDTAKIPTATSSTDEEP